MRIAVFSPLNPIRSGISDFTEELVLKLKDSVHIDLFADNFTPSNTRITKNFDILNIQDIENPSVRSRYDHLLYHIGNNYNAHGRIVECCLKYPGIVELHDFALHHLAAEATLSSEGADAEERYFSLMETCHGNMGLQAARDFFNEKCLPVWEDRSLEFPLNKHIVGCAKAVIVHNDFTKQRLKGMGIKSPIKKINLHCSDITENFDSYSRKCKETLKLDKNLLVFGSFGMATPPKRINEILEALAFVKAFFSDFKYYIVGEVAGMDLKERLSALDLTEHVCCTGFVEDINAFKTYMGACDIVFNLRYPTQGESSASLFRSLGMGKAVFVTQLGSFDELPNDVAIKIKAGKDEVYAIYTQVVSLLKDRKKLLSMKKRARDYVKNNCGLEENCKKYVDFFNVLANGQHREEDYLDTLIDRMSGMGITRDDAYLEQLVSRLWGKVRNV